MFINQELIKFKDSIAAWSLTENLNFFFQEKIECLPYVYPCDNYISTILSSQIVQMALHKVVFNHYGKQVNAICINEQKITTHSHPILYSLLEECCHCLAVVNKPTMYIIPQLNGINALSVGNNQQSTILISPKTITSLSTEEIKFIIGHELGHILQKNMICHMASELLLNLKKQSEVIGVMLADMIEVPLKEWCRCCEFTADRAGLICCKNICHIYSLMEKIDCDRSNSIASDLIELYSDHPSKAKRIQELEFFQTIYNLCAIYR